MVLERRQEKENLKGRSVRCEKEKRKRERENEKKKRKKVGQSSFNEIIY